MRSVYILFAAVILAVLAVAGTAHEDAMPSGIDIHLTPLEAFQRDEVAIEAEIEKDSQHLEGLEVFLVVDKHDIGLSERVPAKEREPGHYVIKYTFADAGDHEIHVEFLHDNETVRQTFDISVSGLGGIEQYFQLAAVLVLLLPAYYAYYHRKYRKALVFAAVLLVAVAVSYSLFVVYSSGAAKRGVTVCVSESECYWSAHIHAEVDIDLCGDKSYRFPIEKGSLDGPHTHEERNLIHFHERLRYDPATKEILDPGPLTLGAFFDAMEVPFDSSKVLDRQEGDLRNGKPGSVKMFVSRNWVREELGQPHAEYRDFIWRDGDVITIVFDEKPAEAVAKEEQKASAEFTPGLTLPIIIGFALVDSINPCVIGVLLLLITVLLKSGRKKAVLVNGSVYALGVYATYLIGGVTLLSIFNAIREVQAISQLFYVAIGIFVLAAAFLEIKDYFWYGRWFSLAIPKRLVGSVESAAKKSHTSLAKAFLFGSLVTLVELPCTGAPYLAIITLMSQSGVQFFSALLFLLLYNIVFILPLIVIIYLAYKGVGYKKMEHWRREHKGRMRLMIGLMLLGISVWIITTVLDWLLFYLVGGTLVAIAIMYILWKLGQKRHSHSKKKTNYSAAIAGIVVLAVAASLFIFSSMPKNVNVDIIDPPPWYAPAVLEIEPGTMVTWHLKSPVVHPVMTLEEPEGAEEIHSGHFTTEWSYKFNEPGLYVYICPVHPYMKGLIGVGEKVPREKIPPWIRWPPEYKDPPGPMPLVPGEGKIWVTAQFHMVLGKEKPGTVIEIDAETWRVEKIIDDKRINNPHNIWPLDGKVIITNWFDKFISVIDTSTGILEKHILLDESPAHVMSMDGKIYVTLQGADAVVVLNATDYSIIKKERAPKGPHGHWMSENGLMALASTEKGKISVWNTTADKIIFEEFLNDGEMVGTGPETHAHSLPLMAGIMPNGSYAFAATSGTGKFYIFDVSRKELVKSYEIGPSPIQTVPSPDWKYIVVPLTGSGEAAIVSTETWEIVKKVADVGFGAHGVAYGKNKNGGTYAYITNKFTTWVTVVDMSTLEIAGYIPLPKDAWGGQGIAVTG